MGEQIPLRSLQRPCAPDGTPIEWEAIAALTGSVAAAGGIGALGGGVVGVVTPGGGYHHQQTAAASVWSITHELGYYPNVTVIDSGGAQVEGDITYDSPNHITITFAYAFSGEAYLS